MDTTYHCSALLGLKRLASALGDGLAFGVHTSITATA